VIELAAAAVCYGAVLLIAAAIALRVTKDRRRPSYPEVAARYAAERKAGRERDDRERDDAGWQRLWDLIASADEPRPEDDPCVTYPENPQQGETP
jgi:hypothetical protein